LKLKRALDPAQQVRCPRCGRSFRPDEAATQGGSDSEGNTGALRLALIAGAVLLIASGAGLTYYLTTQQEHAGPQAAAKPAAEEEPDVPGRKLRPLAKAPPTNNKPPAPEPPKPPNPPAPETAKPPAPKPPPPVQLPAEVRQAIDKGVSYLRKTQGGDGSWAHPQYAVGYTAMAGLTLLECGVPVDDDQVKRAANFLRDRALGSGMTYEAALCILFLDRLGNRDDRPLIRSLGVRLVGGQTASWGWTYTCASPTHQQESDMLTALRSRQPPTHGTKATQETAPRPTAAEAGKALAALPVPLRNAPALQESPQYATSDADETDNSNTQFAVLGLWAASRSGVPVEGALALAARRFQLSQQADGSWRYQTKQATTASMTSAGLLGLALGHGLAAARAAPLQDPAISRGLNFLGQALGDTNDLYFIWSVGRVGSLYRLKDLAGKDWYAWGCQQLLSRQQPDGSWALNGYWQSGPLTDTCFALLFLNRTNLLQDLSSRLQFIIEAPK
jgi:hypothetical protein